MNKDSMPATEPVNLVLVYSPNALDLKDFEKIAEQINAVADNINVHIRQDIQPDPLDLSRLAEHRSFVFSPMQLKSFFVTRGQVFTGRPMLKSEQLLRLQLAGVPVPAWTSLQRGKMFDPDYWGEYVVVKPEISSMSRGVSIFKTASLNRQSSQLKPFARDGNNFIVQKLIRNQRVGKIRVHVFFDEVLYARLFRFAEEIRLETEADMQNYQRLFLTDYSQSEDYYSREVFALAKKCVDLHDGVPMLGLDIVLDQQGRPFFIESNPGGNTWHFSSSLRGRSLKSKGIFLEQQFNAFELAGDLLAKKALELAV